MSRHALLLSAALAALALTACMLTDSTGISESDIACPADSTLTYANFGAQVIRDNCLACHQARDRPFLGTQAQVQAAAQQIIDQAVFHSSMPNGSDMSDAERIQLGQWLSCGAP